MKLSPPCQEIRESKISLYILVTAGENNSYKTFFLFEESLIKISRTSEKIFFFFLYIFLASGGGSPLYPEILQYYTMILQRIRIIVVDAGVEPGTSAPEVWRATNEPPHLHNEPPHLQMSHHIYWLSCFVSVSSLHS